VNSFTVTNCEIGILFGPIYKRLSDGSAKKRQSFDREEQSKKHFLHYPVEKVGKNLLYLW
jgi:hypothetical protein